MTTAAEIRAQIETAKREVAESRSDFQAASGERDDALERQRLRRMLEDLESEKADYMEMAEDKRRERRQIDADQTGLYKNEADPDGDVEDEPAPPECSRSHKALSIGGEHISCSSAVAKGYYTWRIGGMSWLVETLLQDGDPCLESQAFFFVGSHKFDFRYTPSGGCKGTLAICHCTFKSVTLRYKIYIKRRGGDFVQWGEVGNVYRPEDTSYYAAFGPDVPSDGGVTPQGIFGLSHKDLLKSDWVEDDTLTVKFELELREKAPVAIMKTCIQIPPASISADLSLLFETGKNSDVTFVVEDEQIKAHSMILCARSEVFEKLLCGSMRESVTKEIKINDCDVGSFKELIRFVYTDDFTCVESVIEAAGHGNKDGHRVLTLQGLLAASHKYALTRLQLWCEQKLCDCLKVDEVCSILCQAHLYDAKHLLDTCLCFIRQHYEAVAVTQKFGDLAREWPEVMLKINLFMGQVREDRAVSAVEAARKRKREQC